MANINITLTEPIRNGSIDSEHRIQPVQREARLHRVGSQAALMVVEWFPAGDGSLQRRVRFVP